MEEIEKSKMIRTKKVSKTEEVHQVMTALTANTLREVVKYANEESINREDIVSLLKENGQYVLLYYK